ncbi:unnamed protein product [Anisakis simplex]|uniref:Flagellar hook capping protein n=1 Tax=Anisakis simplex TaxID=6269 RepID=A0A0M3JPT4_ANISI|nr:unnamed protein product [Anisakis simplex]
MAILKAASGGSTNPFLSNAQSDLLKTITTKPDQPAVTAPVAVSF